jgi:hypothetical protein
MATSLVSAGPSKVVVTSELDRADSGLTTVASIRGFTYNGAQLTTGTGAGKANKRYVNQHTIAAGGSLTLNLSSLSDDFGNAVAFTKVKEIYIELSSSTAAVSILIGNAANPFVNWVGAGAHTIRVRNGMAFYLGCCADATAYVVTATTADQLKVLNEDGALSAVVNVKITGEG